MESLLSHSRKPDITFHRNGRIDISARIAHKLSLAKGDVIDVTVAENELMLFVKYKGTERIGRHEATVYPTSAGRGTFRTWSKAFVNSMMRIAQVSQADSLKLPCGKEVVRGEHIYIPIIFRNIL